MIRCSCCRQFKSREDFYSHGDSHTSRCKECFNLGPYAQAAPNLSNEELGTRSLEDYPDYAITPDGRVWSHKRWRWLKPGNIQGYLHVRLPSPITCEYESVKVHHLVLLTYVGPRPEGALGLHKDDDKLNNNFSNLEWGTHQINSDQAKANGRLPLLIPKSRRFSDDEIRSIRNRVRSGESMARIAAGYNTGHTTIRSIAIRKSYREVE